MVQCEGIVSLAMPCYFCIAELMYMWFAVCRSKNIPVQSFNALNTPTLRDCLQLLFSAPDPFISGFESEIWVLIVFISNHFLSFYIHVD